VNSSQVPDAIHRDSPPAESNPTRRNPIFRLFSVFSWLLAPSASYRVGSHVFLRLLGVCHLAAFLSVLHQLDGLLGDDGILPASQWLVAVAQQLGTARFWQAPTLCWISPDAEFLHTLCVAGAVVSVLLVLGIMTRVALAALWALYLSVVTVGGVFFGFQWDALLLETTFLACLIAPGSWTLSKSKTGPSRGALLMVWWLLCRLMFASGAVKLLSHDPLWRQFTALAVHFETQPLPMPLAWWAHHLPGWVQTSSCVAMFVIELGVPFATLFGCWGRRFAALAFALLMGGIALTGNYCFFNLLVVAMCCTLLDDSFWKRLFGKFSAAPESGTPVANLSWFTVALTPVLLLYCACSVILTGSQLFQLRNIPSWAALPIGYLAPFRTINTYGLFAVMTKTRPEIILEGSADGYSWKEYQFKYKIGDLKRAPRIVAPYQPRLDWQMWFASLGDIRSNPWFSNLMLRILQGKLQTLSLLEENPFPDKPPRFLRAALFKYKFTTPEVRERTGEWWDRDFQGYYSQPVSLP
jgi:hypothetical protein